MELFEIAKQMRDDFGTNNMLLEVTGTFHCRVLRRMTLSLPGEDL